MSSNSPSKQFKLDINSLFIKLHMIISELEAKIVERDETLREEIKHEVINQIKNYGGQLSESSSTNQFLIEDKKSQANSSSSTSHLTGDVSNEIQNDLEDSRSTIGSTTISPEGSYSTLSSSTSSSSSTNCRKSKSSIDYEIIDREAANCLKCASVCCCSRVIRLPYTYATAISHTSRTLESNPKSESRSTIRGLTSSRESSNTSISLPSSRNANTLTNNISPTSLNLKSTLANVERIVKNERMTNKETKSSEIESDNPVSMVVPVDPSQFIGTTIKHTSGDNTDKMVNTIIKSGVSSTINKSGSISHSVISTAKSNKPGTICDSKNIIHSNNNNNDTNPSKTDNDNSNSGQNCDNHGEPFKNMKNSTSANNQNSTHTTLPLSSSLSSSSSSSSNANRVKENRCPMCAQRFTQLNSLKRHIRSHTGERPFPCGYCEKRFVDRERLKVHVRIHTGEKPFSCNLCSRRFSQKSTVKRHMSVHTGLKPFQCSSCSKRFGTRDNLRVHEKSHFQVDLKFKGINKSPVQSNNMEYL